ncbi:hypothetical protein [Dickeya dadantii]|uniref:hypothetical protein n=1 Tax=Dickeya dadantii TaxID=204038 RepID=UPI001C0CCA23|nr:hypothetical protein [Dickeya dadantii]QWT40913.1 hypothetical protein KNV89_21835 [Dickeya dadantii]
MVKAKIAPDATSPKSERERQAARRDKLKTKIGPAVTLHMSDQDKKRLDSVTDRLTGMYPPGTLERSRAIAELVNQFYIKYVMPWSGDTAEYIHKKHGEIWEMQFIDKMSDTKIAALMSKRGELVPTQSEDGTVSLEKREWRVKDIALYRKARNVGVLVKKASKKTRN